MSLTISTLPAVLPPSQTPLRPSNHFVRCRNESSHIPLGMRPARVMKSNHWTVESQTQFISKQQQQQQQQQQQHVISNKIFNSFNHSYPKFSDVIPSKTSIVGSHDECLFKNMFHQNQSVEKPTLWNTCSSDLRPFLERHCSKISWLTL